MKGNEKIFQYLILVIYCLNYLLWNKQFFIAMFEMLDYIQKQIRIGGFNKLLYLIFLKKFFFKYKKNRN